MIPTLATFASIPSRTKALQQAVESIRPQVEDICVFLNGYENVPAFLDDLRVTTIISPINRGAEAAFWPVDIFPGFVIVCGDDLVYPHDYVATLQEESERWGHEVLVTGHARAFRGEGRWGFESEFYPYWRASVPRWVNYAGTGVSGWDARRVRVPATWLRQNCADAQLAVWAQHSKTPMRLVAHRHDWVWSIPTDGDSIYATSKAAGFEDKNEVMAGVADWQVYMPLSQEARAEG